MKAIVCDRCNSVNGYKDIKYVRINKMTEMDKFNASETEGYEICKKCYKELFGWGKLKKH